jgi:PTH1 family peptidyl-tRNA hydrolase
MSIRLIVGLGNPGPEYEQTRHNAGFWLIDQLRVSLQRDKNFNALVGKTRIAGEEVWLLEPQTFMNRSGQSVGAICRFYKITPDQVLVVHDELDMLPGVAKLKKAALRAAITGSKILRQHWARRITGDSVSASVIHAR